jgi:hypothetical protein
MRRFFSLYLNNTHNITLPYRQTFFNSFRQNKPATQRPATTFRLPDLLL